jgi:hypothetical protein
MMHAGGAPPPQRGLVERALRAAAMLLLRVVEHTALALVAVVHTAQWVLEDIAAVTAADALVFMLVLLSLLAFEVLSLVYIAAAAAGMFHARLRTHTLPRQLTPALSVIAVAQYCCLVMWQPAHDSAAPHGGALRHWLAISPSMTQLAVLLASVAVAASAKHTAAWREATSPTGEAASGAAGTEPHALYYEIAAAAESPGSASVTLAPPAATLRLLVVAQWGKGRVPEVGGRADWGWPQWFRFWIFRLSLDILMVVVVALCTVQRDLIHAGYLGLTLWLFRRRQELRHEGNKLFLWLPFANLCVIILILLFQAPWQELLGGWGEAGDSSTAGALVDSFARVHGAAAAADGCAGLWFFRGDCSLAHLLGLHHITHAGQWRALELTPHGAGIPLLMWLAIQVRTPACMSARTSANFAGILPPAAHDGGRVSTGAVAAVGRAGLPRHCRAAAGRPGAAEAGDACAGRRAPTQQHAPLRQALPGAHSAPRTRRAPQAHPRRLPPLCRRRPQHAARRVVRPGSHPACCRTERPRAHA